MKRFLFLILLTGFTVVLTAQRLLRVEFVSETRGYRESVIFEKSTIHLEVNSTTEKMDSTFGMARKDWNRLQALVSNRFMREMPGCTVVSGGSASDQARSSRIIITRGNKSVESRSFDNYQAPRKLMPIIELVRKYSRTWHPED